MTRVEALKIAKPILFNTEMVRAILGGTKTVTRRVIKLKNFDYRNDADVVITINNGIMTVSAPPISKGDILYVRETFCPFIADDIIDGVKYAYKADATPNSEEARKNLGYKWYPSIHMPKEAARIFLRVRSVYAERLQDINGYGVLAEGVDNGRSNPTMGKRWENMQRISYANVWNSTIKKSDLKKYGWDANPWVWVIEFERLEVE